MSFGIQANKEKYVGEHGSVASDLYEMMTKE